MKREEREVVILEGGRRQFQRQQRARSFLLFQGKKNFNKQRRRKRLYLILYLHDELEPVGLEEGPPV
jgi:hypothetical protein